MLINAVKALNENEIKYVIVGGLAAIIRGSPRTTTDIDIIVRSEPNLSEKLIRAFESVGFEVMRSQVRSAINEGYNASIFMENSVIRIDLKVARKPDEFEVLNQSMEQNYKDITFQMATVEY